MMNKLKNLLLITLGVILIVYVIFNRLILRRSPHDIIFELNPLKIIILIILIILSIIALYIKISKLLSFGHKENNTLRIWKDNILIKKLLLFVNITQNALDKVLELLFNMEILKSIIFYISNLLFPLSENTSWFYFLFINLPRIAVAATFFIDVCIFNQFNYSYKTIPLLILPMIISSIVYMFKFWAEQMREELKDIIIIKLIKSTEIPTELYSEEQIVQKIELSSSTDKYFICKFRKDIDLNNYGDLYVYKNMFYYSLLLLNFEFNFNENGYKNLFLINNCIRDIFFLISWIYILIKMIFY